MTTKLTDRHCLASIRVFFTLLLLVCAGAAVYASPAGGQISLSADSVDVYDILEVTLQVESPDAANPFVDVSVTGVFGSRDVEPVRVDGFCDAQDGSVFRIRFMPTRPGRYEGSIRFQQDDFSMERQVEFTARPGGRRGPVRVDPKHPYHFLWEGTGEHFFWNGTTTYWLLGWDDATIRRSIDRLAGLKVNRLRTAINGRVKDGHAWFENVYPTEDFSFLMNPWVAARPESVENPGFDVTRFNLAHWQKIDRMLRHARDRAMTISIIFYVDGARPGVDPFGKSGMGGPDEQRYYRYAIARLAAFSNVMWDVTNEYHLFRNEDWTNKMGAFIREHDPYAHVMSVHGHGQFPFRTSAWADFAMYQNWDESGGYRFMLDNRLAQAKTGRPIPQINEEYGYEDHYPTWGGNRKAPARSADNRRRLAWGMYMAGGYQTTGERADTGTGWGADTGGGWINGRGDDSMVMLKGYGHIVDFFTAIPWWRMDPNNDFFEIRRNGHVRTDLTHVLYTRNREGAAVLYVDGQRVSSMQVPGEVSAWDDGFRLALGNEQTQDRPWRGELHRVAMYARSLDAGEVRASHTAGLDGQPANPLIRYAFGEGAGDIVRDTSGAGAPLDLKISDATATEWLEGGGLRLTGATLISSERAADKLIKAVTESGALTIEAWIRPADTSQAGPARIVTLSKDTGARNFTLGQKADAYEVRFRTTTTSANGEPALSSPGGESAIPAVVGLRAPAGDLAVLYYSTGGAARIASGSIAADLRARWFNPRSGTYTSAQADESGYFTAPDEQDWALLLDQRQ
jgi:hypothetical protein